MQVTHGCISEYDGVDSRVPTSKNKGGFIMSKNFTGGIFNDCALLFFIILFLLLFTDNRPFCLRDDAGMIE
jgi:hypothetical protein